MRRDTLARRRTSSLALATGLILLPLPCAWAARPPSKQALRAAWQAQWARVHDLEISTTLTNGRTGVTLPGSMIRELAWTLRWDGRRFWWRETQPGSPLAAAISIDTQTRQRRMLYFFDDGRPRGEIRTFSGPYLGATLYLAEMLYPPEGRPAADALSDLLAAPDTHTALRPATELVDDRQAAVLDVFGPPDSNLAGQVIRTIWLDVQRNAVPLMQQWYAPDGRVRFTTRLRNYVEAAPGVWLPTRIESLDAFRHVGVLRVLQVARDADGRPLIRVNSGLTAEDCTVQFPPGTLVTNADTGDWYVATAPDATQPEVLDRVYAMGQQHRQRFKRSTVLSFSSWAALAAAVVAAGLFGLHSGRRTAGR